MHSFSSSPRIHPLSQSQKETTAFEGQWNTLGKNRNAHFSFRTECKRVWSCSIRSATTSGSVTPPSSSSSTRKISSRRKFSDQRWLFVSLSMQVSRLASVASSHPNPRVNNTGFVQAPRSTERLQPTSRLSSRRRTSRPRRRSTVTWPAPPTLRTFSLSSTPWRTWSLPTIWEDAGSTKSNM